MADAIFVISIRLYFAVSDSLLKGLLLIFFLFAALEVLVELIQEFLRDPSKSDAR